MVCAADPLPDMVSTSRCEFTVTYEPVEERRLAYVALTCGMRRVTISHCEFRRGYTGPSGFIADIPDKHRVQGWLRTLGEARPPRVAARFLNDLDDADLLRHF